MHSSDARISFEQRYIHRFKSMENGSASSIEAGFKARIKRLLGSRIDCEHDLLALAARRVSTIHNICKDEVEALCAHVAAEKDRCARQLMSDRPSHTQVLIDRLGQLSPLLTDLGNSRKLPDPVSDHKVSLFQCLWDAKQTKVIELHDELLAKIAEVCDLFSNPYPSLRLEAETNVRAQKPAQKAA